MLLPWIWQWMLLGPVTILGMALWLGPIAWALGADPIQTWRLNRQRRKHWERTLERRRRAIAAIEAEKWIDPQWAEPEEDLYDWIDDGKDRELGQAYLAALNGEVVTWRPDPFIMALAEQFRKDPDEWIHYY